MVCHGLHLFFCRLLGQGYVREHWNIPLGSSRVDIWISSNIMRYPSPEWYMTSGTWSLYMYIQWHPPLIRHFTKSWPCYRTWPYNRFWRYYLTLGGLYRTSQRERLANRGHLLLWTPSPVPFRTCICSNIKTIHSELVMSTDLLSFEHPSILLFCFLLHLSSWIFTQRLYYFWGQGHNA